MRTLVENMIQVQIVMHLLTFHFPCPHDMTYMCLSFTSILETSSIQNELADLVYMENLPLDGIENDEYSVVAAKLNFFHNKYYSV